MLLSALFAFYLSLYFLRLHEYRPETAQTPLLLVTLASCAVIYLLSKNKNINTVQTKFLIGFFVWALLSHVSFGYLQGFTDTFDELVRLLILFFISSCLFVDAKRLEFYFKFIAICALIMAIHGILQARNGIGWTGMPPLIRGELIRIRYIGSFADPNDLGMLFCIVSPFFLYAIKNYKSKLLKLIWACGLAAIMYAIYLTDSRGTLLGLFLMFGLYGWYRFSKKIMLTALGVLVPIAFVATRLSTINSGEASAAGRVDAWTEGIYMLRSDVLFGVGHGLFTDYHHRVAHSSYVQTFAEIGLPGYFFWFGFLFMSMYILYRFAYKYKPDLSALTENQIVKYNESKMLSVTMLYSLLGYAGTAFFITRATQPILFIICGMAAGLITQIYKQDFPNYKKLKFIDCVKPAIFSSVASIVLIYISIRLFW